MRNLFIATAFLLTSGLALQAQPSKPAGSASVEVVEATKQATNSKSGEHAFTEYRFVIIWKEKTPPASEFFYRSGKDWRDLKIARPERRSFGSGRPNDYMMVETTIEAKDVKAGDRLVLTSHRHEHADEEMPPAVLKMASQGLFYATGSGSRLSWKPVRVNIRTLPDRTR